MPPWIDHVVLATIGLAMGGVAGYFIRRRRDIAEREQMLTLERNRLETERLEISKTAREQAADTIRAQREALEESLAQERRLFSSEQEQLARRSEQIDRREQKLEQRENGLDSREAALSERQAACDRREAKTLQREEWLDTQQEAVSTLRVSLEQEQAKADEALRKIAELSQEQAREAYFARLDEELTEESAALISKRLEDAESRAHDEALELIARAIQRYAAEHCAEITSNRVTIADEDMKGRIIGKEGRNIRAFEQLSGVDVIIDDTPGVVTLSCFDPIRREIARRALEELLADGRVHPARIEETLDKCQQDVDRVVRKAGEDAAYHCEVSGLHPHLIKMLGKLKYRSSYGQNVLQHTQEVAFLCSAMAADLGLDGKRARRCGLLHDIGKAIDHEQEGSHPELGYEALKRYGESEIVANAALAHHEGREVLSVYTVLTAAADAISAARPGARRENVERYIKRLQQLEDIACGFKGVTKAYAIQAGRELRVIINGHTLADNVLAKTARSIARRIEDEVAYPGEVKVTLIRETRQSAVAR